MAKRRKARPTDPSTLDSTTRMSREQAVRWIADEICTNGSEDKQVRNKVSQRIGYAIKTGRLPGGDKIPLRRLVSWAGTRTGWKVHFVEWSKRLGFDGSIEASLDGVSAAIYAVQLPSDLQTCHERIIELEQELLRCRARIQGNERELAELRPLLVKKQERSEKSRKAGMQGGRGHTKQGEDF